VRLTRGFLLNKLMMMMNLAETATQWRNQEFMLGVLMFPSPPLPLEVGPQIQL